MGDQTQAYDIFQTPLSSGYPLPLNHHFPLAPTKCLQLVLYVALEKSLNNFVPKIVVQFNNAQLGLGQLHINCLIP
jgi:hypothetical protein